MLKNKIINVSLLLVIMILCIGVASATTYFSEDFSTNYADCGTHPDITRSGGSCVIENGTLTMSNTGSTSRLFFNLDPIMALGGNMETHTTSYIIKYNQFSSAYPSLTDLSATSQAVVVGNHFFSNDNYLYINNIQTLLTKDDFEGGWHSFDYVFNTTNNKVYVYVDGVLRSINNQANPSQPYEILNFRGYNYATIDNLIIQDGIFINTDYSPTTCNDGIDNDGDGFIDKDYDPDCEGSIDNEEDVNNTYSGVFWSENFNTPSVDCSIYDMYFEEVTTYPTRGYSCSVSSGAMNLGLLNYNGYFGFPTRISGSDRINKDYTLTYKIMLSSQGATSTAIMPSRDDTSADELGISTWSDISGYELSFSGNPTGINMTDYLDQWVVFDLYYNSTSKNVSLYFDGQYILEEQIADFYGTNELVDLAFENLKDGSSITSATQLKIDKVSINWGDTSGQESLTGCTDGADNDGDGFIDDDDRDCLTKDVEDNFDDYPVLSKVNITLFDDHFNNSNFTSEGWAELSTSDCLESTYNGNTVVRGAGSDCIVTQDFDVGTHSIQNYDFVFVPRGSTKDNYIKWYDSPSNYISMRFDQDPDRLRITGYGECGDGSAFFGYQSMSWTNGVPQKISMRINKTSGIVNFYYNDVFLTSYNKPSCFDYDQDITVKLDLDNNDMEIDRFSIININKAYDCDDGIDNDNDGYVDYPQDIDCVTPYDSETEKQTHICNDGIDNDNDGYTDYPEDVACLTEFGTDEFPKQGTTCQDKVCTETESCILDFSFDCAVAITNFQFATLPSWYGDFVNGEMYNSRTVIPLHEYLGYGVLLDNGSIETTDTVVYLKEYSSNNKDYEIINNKFDLFFDYQFEEDGVTPDNISNEYIRYKFYNSDYNVMNKLFEVVLRPLSYHDEVYIKVYTVDEFNVETLIGTMRTIDAYDHGRIELNIDIDTQEQNYNVWWQDRFGISEDSSSVDFDIYTYNYPDRFSFEVGGDPMYFSSELKSESKMYLNNIRVFGEPKDTTTICTTWEKPYYFKEEFNGLIENCGWAVTPENLYFDGQLYITEDLEIFRADKDFSSVGESQSRYVTLDFTANAYSYVDNLGYTLIEMMDIKNEPVFAIYISEGVDDLTGSIGYYSDGDFVELQQFNYSDTERIYVIYDFNTDTFKLLSRGQNSVLKTIGTSLPIVNPASNPTTISNLKIFGYRGSYAIDSIKFYTSDSEGTLVSLEDISNGEIFDPYPDMVGDSMCGYIVSKQDSSFCAYDSECATGVCVRSTGRCSSFDYNYCDENGYTRGSYCVASAVTSCGLTKTKDILLDNFLLVLVFIMVIMFAIYFILITRRG